MSSTAMEPRLRKEDDEDRQADRRLGGGDRQHEQREDLADQVAEKGREGDEVDVDREQDQLDRHQDDDDVLAVQEDAEDAEREQDRGDGEVVARPTLIRQIPSPELDLATSIAVSRVRPTCGDGLALDVRLMLQGEHDGADHRDQQDRGRPPRSSRRSGCRAPRRARRVLLTCGDGGGRGDGARAP